MYISDPNMTAQQSINLGTRFLDTWNDLPARPTQRFLARNWVPRFLQWFLIYYCLGS